MSARDNILRAVRASKPSPVDLPDLSALSNPKESQQALFDRFVISARGGGADVIATSREDLGRTIAAELRGATHILSSVPAIAGTVEPMSNLETLTQVDLFVCESSLGVAESGAVWLPLSRLASRAGVFLAERALVILDAGGIVADMHAAYACVDVAAEAFGMFMLGPSKTADIEQSLVIGAQGPKRLTIVVTIAASAPSSGISQG